MHELGIALEVLDVVAARAGTRRVRGVTVTIGTLAAVLPESLEFCFGLATEGTPAEGAVLTIVQRPGVARCRVCQGYVELLRPYGQCVCGGTDLDVLHGDEIEVSELLLEVT